MTGKIIFILFGCILKYLWIEKKQPCQHPIKRTPKRVNYYSNGRMLPNHLNLTVYYADVIKIPKTVAYVDADLVHYCYKQTEIFEDENSFITKEDRKAAELFLVDRLEYVESFN